MEDRSTNIHKHNHGKYSLKMITRNTKSYHFFKYKRPLARAPQTSVPAVDRFTVDTMATMADGEIGINLDFYFT